MSDEQERLILRNKHVNKKKKDFPDTNLILENTKNDQG